MVRCLCLALLPLGCLSFSSAGFRMFGGGGEGGLPKGQQRVVMQKCNATDPYESAWHWDDWVSTVAAKHLDLRRPVCVTAAGEGAQRCKLLSQTLCTGLSRKIPRTDESLGMCFKRRKSCAVVGSSAHLLNASWGASIDRHDLVIRVNGAPAGSADRKSERFPLGSHVGTRTDARFVNTYGSVPDDLWSAPPTCVFLHEPQIPTTCGLFCWEHPGTCNVTCPEGDKHNYCRTGKCDVSFLQCRGMGQKTEKVDWGGHHVFLDNVHSGIADRVVPHSTAGFKAVIYAMSICDRVSIFGFGPACDGSIGSRYYRQDIWGITTYHHYSEELALLIRAGEAGTDAIIPPEARSWITAKSVTVALPTCVDREAVSQLGQTFQRFGSHTSVNTALEASLDAF